MFEDRTKPRTEIKDLGEFGLIDFLTDDIELEQKSSEYGVGDDAAVNKSRRKTCIGKYRYANGRSSFRTLLMYLLKHLGYKAAVVNFSDIAAYEWHSYSNHS